MKDIKNRDKDGDYENAIEVQAGPEQEFADDNAKESKTKLGYKIVYAILYSLAIVIMAYFTYQSLLYHWSIPTKDVTLGVLEPGLASPKEQMLPAVPVYEKWSPKIPRP